MILTREFTRKECVILALLALFLLGMVYYRFVYVPLEAQIESYDTSELELELQTEQARAAKIARMKTAMEQADEVDYGLVAVYSNQKAEISILNDIFGKAEAFSISFDNPVADGDLVRRDVKISFTVDDYETAQKMIKTLEASEYMCLLRSMSISPADKNTNLEEGLVKGSITATFYETLYGAENTEGIEDEE